MAKRPVFIPLSKKDHLVQEISFDFQWNGGFSVEQKKKNISALHTAAASAGLFPLLEVSTKSDEKVGQHLSAFNLKIETPAGKISIESAFQGSKVFENGGQYIDIYTKDSVSAKKDERLRSSGAIVGFNYFGQEWPTNPKTAFYDWLYLSALQPHQEYLKRLFKYKGFTDIEFNPERSINCQARTCALLMSLIKLDLLDYALISQKNFISVILSDSFEKIYSQAA